MEWKDVRGEKSCWGLLVWVGGYVRQRFAVMGLGLFSDVWEWVFSGEE